MTDGRINHRCSCDYIYVKGAPTGLEDTFWCLSLLTSLKFKFQI